MSLSVATTGMPWTFERDPLGFKRGSEPLQKDPNDVIFGGQSKGVGLHLIGDEDDVIEQERRTRKPLHKRLEYVAGWNIHDLVKDARKSRTKLHTRKGFHLKSSVSDIASLFESSSIYSCRTGTASTKSSHRSSITTVSSSTLRTTIRFYDMMRFHVVHGSNVALSSDRYVASRRPKSFCDGLVFGNRAVKLGETIHLRFNKVRPDWRGCIRLGFTHHDPTRLDPMSLPSFARPDLSRKARFWGVPIKEKYATKYNIFSFTCKGDGSVSYLINNENKGTLLKGLNTKQSLWPMLDLYGKVEELAFVDDDSAQRGASMLGFVADDDDDAAVDSRLARRQSAAPLSENQVAFHDTRGCNIRTDAKQIVAKRYDSFWNALTFTAKPLQILDIMFAEIVKVEKNYAGSLGVGITNVDPATLKSDELPDNADLLVIKPGRFWRISRDLESDQGDQFSFVLDSSGTLVYNKNGTEDKVLFSDIPTEQPSWLIFDVYGSTKTIKLMGKIRSYDPSDPVTAQKYNFEENDIQDDEEEKECLMCFKQDRTRDCTIQPCGHLTLCNWCAITCMVKQQLRFIVCPICGGPVKHVVRILKRQPQEVSSDIESASEED